jgi:hypothetical protein
LKLAGAYFLFGGCNFQFIVLHYPFVAVDKL